MSFSVKISHRRAILFREDNRAIELYTSVLDIKINRRIWSSDRARRKKGSARLLAYKCSGGGGRSTIFLLSIRERDSILLKNNT